MSSLAELDANMGFAGQQYMGGYMPEMPMDSMERAMMADEYQGSIAHDRYDGY